MDLKKRLDLLEVKVRGLTPQKEGGGPIGADPAELIALKNELDNLRKEFYQHRDWATRNINDLNVTMPTKADKQDLIDLEQRI